jgi:hypothetical protein
MGLEAGSTETLVPIYRSKVKPSLEHAVEAHRFVRRRGSQIFLDSRFTDGGEVVSHTRQPPFTLGRFLVLISVRC